MRVCIFTLGSRGDVQPYLALMKNERQLDVNVRIQENIKQQAEQILETIGIPTAAHLYTSHDKALSVKMSF